jgi:septal ring-binding cell division protein DamX
MIKIKPNKHHTIQLNAKKREIEIDRWRERERERGGVSIYI